MGVGNRLAQQVGTSGPDVRGVDARSAERTHRVAIADLVVAGSPRLGGESSDHVRVLADSDQPLPPITVHRPTMRVLDGIHRLRAAVFLGRDEIDVTFFDGDEVEAFVVAVQANISHGLPLSLADRTAAAKRIIEYRPQWSDRRISAIAGMSARSVAQLRRQLSPEIEKSVTRTGRDGRIRPVNGAAGRRRASELLRANPTASVREIARTAGISVSTASNVRARLRAGEDPVPPKLRDDRPWELETSRRRRPECQADRADDAALVAALKADPSLRLSVTGRTLLRCLDSSSVIASEAQRLADTTPAHCVAIVGELARQMGDGWHDLAARLEQRDRAEGSPSAGRRPRPQRDRMSQ